MIYTAYDYDKQEWVTGEQARRLLINQKHEQWQLLISSKGDEYVRAIGAPSKAEFITKVEHELAALGAW